MKHRTYELPRRTEDVKQTITRFFTESAVPCADFSTIPQVMMAATTPRPGGALIDGSGNDRYMGFMPARKHKLKFALRVRGRPVARAVQRILPIDSPVNYLTRPKNATSLIGRTFRHHEIRRFYPEAIDAADYWYEAANSADEAELMDFMTVSQGRHTDIARILIKIPLIAEAMGLVPVAPFCDDDLAEYYFNLPESERFDRDSHRNKLLLRELLAEALDYDPAAVGSHWFGFDGPQFMMDHHEWIRSEVLSCELWQPSIRAYVLDMDGQSRVAPAAVSRVVDALHGLGMAQSQQIHPPAKRPMTRGGPGVPA